MGQIDKSNTMKRYISLLALLFTFTISHAQVSPETIPAFSILDINGETFTNEDMSSNTNSYIVYFNPECGHCETAFKTLNINAKALDLEHVTFYAVAANSKGITREFFDDIAPKLLELKNIKILLDEDFVFANAFQVGSYPTVYFYDKDGKFDSRFEGAEDVLNPIKELR